MNQNKLTDNLRRIKNLEQLDLFVEENYLDPNNAVVANRRHEILCELFITDCDEYSKLSKTCDTLESFYKLIESNELDRNHPAAQARLLDLTVKFTLLFFSFYTESYIKIKKSTIISGSGEMYKSIASS